MAPRTELHALLVDILGSENVYFQPPPSINMNYPAIVYNRSTANTRFANNSPYSIILGYEVTIIDKNPDSLIPDKVAHLPLCTFSRHFTADNLNHDVYNLFF